jgi:ABC-type lipopolysaccharide export system ATPase subunit
LVARSSGWFEHAGGALIAEGNAAAIRDNRKVQQVYLGTGLRRAALGGARP